MQTALAEHIGDGVRRASKKPRGLLAGNEDVVVAVLDGLVKMAGDVGEFGSDPAQAVAIGLR